MTHPAFYSRFWLDRSTFAGHLIATGEVSFGIAREHSQGIAAAIVERFRDAQDAGAIKGPAEAEPALYATVEGGLILAVREPPLKPAASRRQVATFCFATEEVACPGDDRFEECCAVLGELLRRAGGLLPELQALAEMRTLPSVA